MSKHLLVLYARHVKLVIRQAISIKSATGIVIDISIFIA